MQTISFVVHPSARSFESSDLTSRGDEKDAYFKAHLHAAKSAANSKSASWVTRSDTGSERYGFGRNAFVTPTTVLYKIMQLGLSSYWCDASTSWVPLPIEEEDAMLDREVEVV
jgi:hypothetical protein